MSEVRSILKDTSKKLKEQKTEEKKILNSNIKKPTGKSSLTIHSNLQKTNSKSNDKPKPKEIPNENEKANLTARDKIEINKQTSSDNKSFSENDISEYDDEWRNLNELFHTLLGDTLQIDQDLKKKFVSIKDFLDEHYLTSIILEIEPNFYEISGLTDKLISDFGENSFSIKYGNFITLLKTLNEYFKNSPESYRFSRNLNINNMINLNEFLRGDQTQIMILSELTLILFSISTKKDFYLDIINNSEQNLINNFLFFLEKYLFFDIRDESIHLHQQNSDDMLNNYNQKQNNNNINNNNNYYLNHLNSSNFDANYNNIQNISNIINLNNQLSSNIFNSAEGKEKSSDNNIVLDENALGKGTSYKSFSYLGGENDYYLKKKSTNSVLPKINQDLIHIQGAYDTENKYIINQSNNQINSNNLNNLNSNNVNNTNLLNSTGIFNRTKTKTYIKKMDFEENEKKKLLSIIELLKKEVSSYTEKNEELSNSLLDLELKHKDCLREIEILNRNNKNQLTVQVESYNDVLQVATLRNELMKKELEIEEIKRDYELDLKRYSDELFKSRQKMEVLEDKNENLKYFQYENEKLKIKIKEFNMFKDKISDYDNLVSCVESKNLQIEKLIKEKQNLLLQNENTIKELLQEREKLKLVEFEKKKLDYELYDIQKEFSRFEPRRNSTNPTRVPNIRDIRYSLLFNSKSKRVISTKNDLMLKQQDFSKNELENETDNNTIAGLPLSVINKNNCLNIPGYITNNNSKVNFSKIHNCEKKLAEKEGEKEKESEEENNFRSIKNFLEIGESRNIADKLKTERAMGIKNFLSQVEEVNENKNNENYKKPANTHRDNARLDTSLIQDVNPEKGVNNLNEDNFNLQKKTSNDSKKQIIFADNSSLLLSAKKPVNNSNIHKNLKKEGLKLDLKNINNIVKYEKIDLNSPINENSNTVNSNPNINSNKNVSVKSKEVKTSFLVIDSDKNVTADMKENNNKPKEDILNKQNSENNQNNEVINVTSVSDSSDELIDQATFNALEAEFFDIKARYEELNESYKEQMDAIQKTNLEKDELIKINEQNKIEIQNLISIVDKTIIEKEKIEISRQKSEIEYQKLLLVIDRLENEKRKFFDENIEIKQKINIMINDKQLLKNEIAEIKKQLKMKSYQIERLLKEKKDLVGESPKNNLTSSPLKNRKVSSVNANNAIKINPRNSTIAANYVKRNSIGEQDLKVEINKLKTQLTAVESQNILLRSKLENKETDNSANSNNNNNYFNLNTEEELLNLKKERSIATTLTNNNSSNNKNNFTVNSNVNNTSIRKSLGNFITEPNETTINSNMNYKDVNNHLAFKSKQASMDYDNFRYNTETEANQNQIQNRIVISEKQHSNPLIKNSKIKKASITEYANKQNSNYHSTGNQNAVMHVTPVNKILLENINNKGDNFSSQSKNNKFIDKSKSRTKKHSNKLIPEEKGYTMNNKSNYVSGEKEEKNLNISKSTQEKINLQDNIQKTKFEGLLLNRENEAENDNLKSEMNENKQNLIQANFDFYKKSIEEHRKIMDSEHEIIADSLYDLAVHFLTFKNELLNSIKPTIINNQIHMNVNNYNQDNVNSVNNNINNNENLLLNNDANANSNLNHNYDKNDNFSINKSIFGECNDKK